MYVGPHKRWNFLTQKIDKPHISVMRSNNNNLFFNCLKLNTPFFLEILTNLNFSILMIRKSVKKYKKNDFSH